MVIDNKEFYIIEEELNLNTIEDESDLDYYEEVGIVSEVGDGIVTISGLANVAFGEMIEIIIPGSQNVVGIILNIEFAKVSAVVFSNDIDIVPGYLVIRKYVLMSVPTGRSLLGRIVDPLGNPLDELGPIVSKGPRFIEQVAPSIISRAAVRKPLETGLKVVDTMVPIGHGQRELIIGDTKTGKTSIAIDAILNQRTEDTICIYVAIGQKRSSVARIAKVLKANNCLDSAIIVAATASDTAAMQYIAPYSGCSMGEYFMNLGLRVLIIYDDLSKHAVSYRQLSLLLRRPPGREGYPGDVFFLHSRLLERSANLKNNGSITALPII
jgi:F-type H+-transporting ATPase subunit alpha